MAERKELQLQGPRPSALKITRDSHKIKKPPLPLPPNHRPVIIYTVSPKIIHTDPTEFKDLVQRLTGRLPDAPDNHDQAPSETMSMLMSSSTSTIERGVERIGHFPSGILSPTPGSLPRISPNIFSVPPAAAADLSPLTRFFQDLSPIPSNFSSDFFQNFPDNFH